jgi:heme/copper-type cytochrome/quinol oxidase subunit 3
MSAAARPIATTRSAAGMPTGRLAVWWIIASEIVIFGGVLASYIMYRLAHSSSFGAQAIHTSTAIGAFNTLVLLSSSLAAVLGHKYAEEGDGAKAARQLYLTMLGGIVFIVVKSFEWYGEITSGFTISSHPFWSFYYTAAGIHAMHVIAGVIIMGFVSQTARKNQELHRVELIGVYWHFVDVVWIFLFPLLYIAK